MNGEVDEFGRALVRLRIRPGESRLIEVIANEGAVPLLGVQLLVGRRLTVDYSEMTVAIE